jgi:hypothetical protein
MYDRVRINSYATFMVLAVPVTFGLSATSLLFKFGATPRRDSQKLGASAPQSISSSSSAVSTSSTARVLSAEVGAYCKHGGHMSSTEPTGFSIYIFAIVFVKYMHCSVTADMHRRRDPLPSAPSTTPDHIKRRQP